MMISRQRVELVILFSDKLVVVSNLLARPLLTNKEWSYFLIARVNLSLLCLENILFWYRAANEHLSGECWFDTHENHGISWKIEDLENVQRLAELIIAGAMSDIHLTRTKSFVISTSDVAIHYCIGRRTNQVMHYSNDTPPGSTIYIRK